MARPSSIKPGNRYGRLVVLETDSIRKRHRYWKCRCDCGNECVIAGSSLQGGFCKSCGCLRKEIAKSACHNPRKMENLHLEEMKRYQTNISIITQQRPGSNNTSGHKGVCFDKESGKWIAYIDFKRKRHWLGYYRQYDDAVKAREMAEKQYFEPILQDLMGK